jgi:DNA-binding transcriptional LysR family regulator
MDRLEGMAALVSVAKAGGFSAASRETGIPLATLSRRVADLEGELGVPLLRRSTRQIALTETGQSYFQTCQRVLDEIRDAEENLKGEYRADGTHGFRASSPTARRDGVFARLSCHQSASDPG